MATNQVTNAEIYVSDEDFFDNDRQRRDRTNSSNEIVKDEDSRQTCSRKSSSSKASNSSDSDSDSKDRNSKSVSEEFSAASDRKNRRVTISARLPRTEDVENESELKYTHAKKPTKSTSSLEPKLNKKQISQISHSGSEPEEESDFPKDTVSEIPPRNSRRVKSAPTRRGRADTISSSKPDSKLTNNKELLREVLELDSRYMSYSRPASASTSSSLWRNSRPKSAAVEIPYRWRRNYTFTDEKVLWIERENKRLLSRIQNSTPEINKDVSTSGYGFNKQSATELHRSRKLREIEVENLALLKRLQSIQPSRDISRDFLIGDYVRRQTEYLGGSANIIWARPQETKKPRSDRVCTYSDFRGSKKHNTAPDQP